VACYFIWMHFGFLPAAILLGPLCLFAMGVRAVKMHAVVLALTVLISVVFTRLLGVQLL